ncbi:hypothetical protein TSUD_53360 [Trifolium subterraneum]|uniref:Uncharacterized protein n=1 Tax=Trifolium subterraneum TaxID=3900 RepID=A0A2Z6MJ11_TRISU|nr:hypothetical protein TSUD_53360 [Trifolium subterraneum]
MILLDNGGFGCGLDGRQWNYNDGDNANGYGGVPSSGGFVGGCEYVDVRFGGFRGGRSAGGRRLKTMSDGDNRSGGLGGGDGFDDSVANRCRTLFGGFDGSGVSGAKT